MIVCAPGKLVLSGAYAVLEGSPAIVTAVDRFAYADATRRAAWTTPEVSAALGAPGPWFDATELRGEEHKLGLGSSAAILVASMAAQWVSDGDLRDWDAIRQSMFPAALRAHQLAQAGGSGLDVAASCFGGTLEYQLKGERAAFRPIALPSGLYVESWDSQSPASTPEFVQKVKALKARDASLYAARIGAQADAATRAVQAARDGDLDAWITAIAQQHSALSALGQAAHAPIITESTVKLHRYASDQNASVLPSGAGGGDVILYFGHAPSSEAWRAAARRDGYRLVPLDLGAEGVSGPARLPG